MTTVLYRVELLGSETLGDPVSLRKALRQVRLRVPREHEGALRILRVEYGLDPAHPPGTIYTPAQRQVWQATVERFPDIGTAGTYVCKPASQHRYGNATDWTAPPGRDVSSYLGQVWTWQLDQARTARLPISELIFQTKIATKAHAWLVRHYDGVPHVAHVHDSADPLIDTSRPCGDVR